ncbi:MAG: N-acetylmuramoyl-L-alanine amidase [Myxococcota bacterium]
MLLWLLACTPAPVHAEMIAVLPREPVSVAPDPVWPETSDVLALLPDRPCAEPRETVFVMAGHANGRTKTGNLGVHGQVEADVNLALAEDLAAHLERTGCFEVVRGRTGTQRPSYRSRIAHAERVGADAFIELHTDARGPLEPVGYTPDAWVYEAEGALASACCSTRAARSAPSVASSRGRWRAAWCTRGSRRSPSTSGCTTATR